MLLAADTPDPSACSRASVRVSAQNGTDFERGLNEYFGRGLLKALGEMGDLFDSWSLDVRHLPANAWHRPTWHRATLAPRHADLTVLASFASGAAWDHSGAEVNQHQRK